MACVQNQDKFKEWEALSKKPEAIQCPNCGAVKEKENGKWIKKPFDFRSQKNVSMNGQSGSDWNKNETDLQ